MISRSIPHWRQPWGAVALAPAFADAEICLLGSSRVNRGLGKVQPSAVGTAVYGAADSQGVWFGPKGPGEGYVSLPNTAVTAGPRYSGVVITSLPALVNNGTFWTNWYDAAGRGGDPGFWIGFNSQGGVAVTLQDNVLIYASPPGLLTAGRVHVVAWSYDGASGRLILIVDGRVFTAVNAQPTQTTAQVQAFGGYYDFQAVGLGEKRFYLGAIWGREMNAQTLLRIGSSPTKTYSELFAPQRIVVPFGASAPALPTLTALTMSHITQTSARWTVA